MAKRSYDDVSDEIIGNLDIVAEYQQMGVRMARSEARSSGKMPCYAADRDERNPSAYIDVNTGRYGDSKSGKSCSLWDFAIEYGGFSGDWQASRRHFAEKAGVKLTKSQPDNWRIKLEFLPWDHNTIPPAQVWCRRRNFSFGAVRAAGARIARWPCYIDKKTSERKLGKYRVLALPAYGPSLLDRDPVSWVCWNLFGPKLEIYRGKGKPTESVKMLSVGETYGTLMNQHSLMQLQQAPAQVACIWKTAGPTDMLALLSRLPREVVSTHLVVTNASGEAGDVPDEIAAHFTGHHVFIVHDADRAGELGSAKWLQALAPIAASVRHVRLFDDIAEKHGKDLRDYADQYDHDSIPNTNAATESADVLSAPAGPSENNAALCD